LGACLPPWFDADHNGADSPVSVKIASAMATLFGLRGPKPMMTKRARFQPPVLQRAAVVVLLRLGDRREPLPQILRAGRGMQLAGIRLPGRNLRPHHVAFALGVGPGLEVVQGAEQVIALAPARLAGPLLELG